MTYGMTCTCGHQMTVEANSLDEAKMMMKTQMNETGIAAHWAEFHQGEAGPMPTPAECASMIDANLMEIASPMAPSSPMPAAMPATERVMPTTEPTIPEMNPAPTTPMPTEPAMPASPSLGGPGAMPSSMPTTPPAMPGTMPETNPMGTPTPMA